MFDELNAFLKVLNATPPDERSVLITMSIFTSVMYSIYYIVLGTVIIVLGRRIIWATQSALKENKREPA